MMLDNTLTIHHCLLYKRAYRKNVKGQKESLSLNLRSYLLTMIFLERLQ